MAASGSANKAGKGGRVQGIESVVDDLTLIGKDGSLELELGVSLTDNPKLTRTIFGASSIELEVFDPERRLLRHSLVSEQWDVELDGMHFRYPGGMTKSGDTLTLTLEDRWMALLREKKGPKRVVRGDGPHQMTRAEFIKMLVEEACGKKLRFYCPRLHVVQPIDSKAKAKKAKQEAKENRGKGIGDVRLTMDGAALTAAQKELGQAALEIAASFNAPFAVEVAAIEALMTESSLGSASPGNVLQALEPYTKIRSAEEEISGFIAGRPTWTGTTAIGYHRENPGAAPHEIAQAVQKSGAGESTDGKSNYGKFDSEARKFVEEFGGGEASEAIQVNEPYEFVVKKKQDYWSVIKELAKEVNWRAFIVGDVFYYMPEPELLQGMVRLAIDGDTPGVENVDFEYDGNNPVTEIEIEARVGQWKPPPASVVTLVDHGPASIGFGDAPVKKDAKGRKAGVSSNRNAKTGEGRGRYLVGVIEVPLADDPAQRTATIKAHKPTAPLPEPANATRMLSAGGTAPGEMGTLEGTPEDIVNQVVDYAHGHGFSNVTRESVRTANASHGPTVSGGRSDHQGPPDQAWAADISNGYTTPEEDKLAQAIADAFEIPWDGSGLVTVQRGDYEIQLIYRTMEGGDHFTHVHFGCHLS